MTWDDKIQELEKENMQYHQLLEKLDDSFWNKTISQQDYLDKNKEIRSEWLKFSENLWKHIRVFKEKHFDFDSIYNGL